MPYETVIGLEVHVELKTESKVFCSCSTAFGAAPNSQVCPVCLGLPGVLPVLNEKALDYAIVAGLALGGRIAEYSKFDRKNYFYPDLPKAYQISQYDLPLVVGGQVEIDSGGQKKRIGIIRIHLEEDTGKLVHAGDLAESASSVVDFNRCGVPLLEIVSQPDIRSPEEAKAYLTELRTIIAYTGISDVKMEEGSLRCDANVSLRPEGASEFGTRTEIKNLNSFRAVQKALEYEVERQCEVLESGGRVVLETRHWDEAKGVTVPLRSKEEADEYRYFPEPDLPAVVMEPERVERLRRSLPEPPAARRDRYVVELGLTPYAAEVLTAERPLADFFERAAARYGEAAGQAGAAGRGDASTVVANWILGDLLRIINAAGLDFDHIPVTPANLAGMLQLIDAGTISGKIAKSVFEEMCATGKDPAAIVKEKGLVQISDEAELARTIASVLDANPQPVADYLGGKETAAGFLVGQVMKATRGRANPAAVNRLLREELERRR